MSYTYRVSMIHN